MNRSNLPKKWLFVALLALQGLALSNPASAAKDKFTALPGAMFNIDSYDPVTQTYALTYLKYPAQGPLVTTPEYLAQAIPAIKLERLKRSPDSVVSQQYQTDQTLYLLMPEAIEARKKKFSNEPDKPSKKKKK
jgi:hypothetical protein